jgi:hypothetical protein
MAAIFGAGVAADLRIPETLRPLFTLLPRVMEALAGTASKPKQKRM